jgi:hypothetical protein
VVAVDPNFLQDALVVELDDLPGRCRTQSGEFCPSFRKLSTDSGQLHGEMLVWVGPRRTISQTRMWYLFVPVRGIDVRSSGCISFRFRGHRWAR